MRALILSAAVLAISCAQPKAFDDEGQSIIAELAQRRLDPAVAEKVRGILLGSNASLASQSVWAEDYRDRVVGGAETTNWHFVLIPLDAAGYDAARDCKPSPQGDCVVAAIEREIAMLAEEGASKAARIEALRFVVNLVGEIHQPLNCAERDGDGGGIRLAVTYKSDLTGQTVETNFHEVWDSLLIEDTFAAWQSFVDELESDWFANHQEDDYASGTVIDWVNDCKAMAAFAYADLPSDLQLGDGYLDAQYELLSRQLAVGGIRLARLLNEALD